MIFTRLSVCPSIVDLEKGAIPLILGHRKFCCRMAQKMAKCRKSSKSLIKLQILGTFIHHNGIDNYKQTEKVKQQKYTRLRIFAEYLLPNTFTSSLALN